MWYPNMGGTERQRPTEYGLHACNMYKKCFYSNYLLSQFVTQNNAREML